jgi:hypothetical protein
VAECVALCNAQRWYHSLLLFRFAAEPVRDSEANLDRIAFAHVDAIKEHFLLHTVWLERRNVAAGLGTEV